jgi:hypothetical protein
MKDFFKILYSSKIIFIILILGFLGLLASETFRRYGKPVAAQGELQLNGRTMLDFKAKSNPGHTRKMKFSTSRSDVMDRHGKAEVVVIFNNKSPNDIEIMRGNPIGSVVIKRSDSVEIFRGKLQILFEDGSLRRDAFTIHTSKDYDTIGDLEFVINSDTVEYLPIIVNLDYDLYWP